MVEPRDLWQRRKLFNASDLVSRNEAGVKPLGQRTRQTPFVRPVLGNRLRIRRNNVSTSDSGDSAAIGEFRQITLMRRSRQRHGQSAVSQHAWLQDIWIGFTLGDRHLPRTGPAERFQHVDDRAGLRQRQTGTIAFVLQIAEHPRSRWFPQRLTLPQFAPTVVHKGQFFDIERSACGVVQRIDDLLGGQTATFRSVEEPHLAEAARFRPTAARW